MDIHRRAFLKRAGCLAGAGAGSLVAAPQADASYAGPADPNGVLVDLTACIGCRLCEFACKQANGIEAGKVESYDDQSVFRNKRRPQPNEFTVVNMWPNGKDEDKPVYAKVNCMHCNHAACVSACIVGALTKNENGAVVYDAWKCIGCRYCMVACPFQIPAYEYDNVLTPRVRKCEFCSERVDKGEKPACITACPRQAMTFGKRKELLTLAHHRVNEHPEKYIKHIYGEHEVGGTSWMYLSQTDFDQAGFLPLGQAAPPVLTEAIQHGVFKYWIAPVGWYSFLAAAYWWTGRKARAAARAVKHAVVRERSEELVSVGGGSDRWATEEDDTLPLEEEEHHEESHDHAAPVDRKLLTPGVWALIAMVVVGFAFMAYRFFFGLAASTNLDQQYPWGLWIAMDVGSGIALAGGGFVTAAIVHIFHREHYHAVARSALLTALLGYTFYVPGLLADIGRWYNIWHPTIPTMWQGNSVLFEVGLCVMIYLNVQYAELAPIICGRLLDGKVKRPFLRKVLQKTHDVLEKIMPALLILGVALSTFHQSSLGNLMVIAPYKLHALWWTPWSPLLFLLSAMMVGLPMVIFTILFASWCVSRKPEMHVLAPLARYVPVFLFIYLAVKVADIVSRPVHATLFDGSVVSASWLVEVVLGVVAPLVMFLVPRIRRSPKWLAITCLMVILGVVLNRLNVFVIGYTPPFANGRYYPSLTECMVSMGLVAALLLVYRIGITWLPILDKSPERGEA